ncbi:hypothetical protein WG622_12725 [Cognatishimia sp. D5M38]|uniref:Uncharacterized protein n=1 Tax=Cognatishimia coralii TaxID=3083254 RepID=A0ABU8QI66_9RHOB
MAWKREKIRQNVVIILLAYLCWYLAKYPFYSEEAWGRWGGFLEIGVFVILPILALMELIQWLWGKLKRKKNESN